MNVGASTTLACATRAAVLGLLLLQPVPVRAQSEPDPAKVRMRIGPLWLNPTIALTNLGVDQNVFYEAANPKRDFTATVTPQTELWLAVGRTWISGTIKEEVVWYQTYASERSANNRYILGWRVPLNRLILTASGTYADTHDRSGYEIDARARHVDVLYKGTVEVRALSKTFIGVNGQRQKLHFDSEARFRGANLREELNHTTTAAGVLVRNQLTPLTALTFNVTRSQDRFDQISLRDSNSTAFAAAVSFDPVALLKGGASIGYRNFEPVSSGLPRYNGTTAAVDLSYSLLGTTRFALQANRDIQYSYDINQPYYLQTGVSGSIAQQIFGPFDVIARGGVQKLAYRDRAGVVVEFPNRTDNIHWYGLGVGFHFATDVRLGFNVDRQRHLSDIAERRYSGLKYGTSLTYTF